MTKTNLWMNKLWIIVIHNYVPSSKMVLYNKHQQTVYTQKERWYTQYRFDPQKWKFWKHQVLMAPFKSEEWTTQGAAVAASGIRLLVTKLHCEPLFWSIATHFFNPPRLKYSRSNHFFCILFVWICFVRSFFLITFNPSGYHGHTGCKFCLSAHAFCLVVVRSSDIDDV